MMDYGQKETHFVTNFEKHWQQYLATHSPYQQAQLQIGNRLRPRLVFWGAAAAGAEGKQAERLLDIATGIEIIHKVSIILDDYIDCDIARHGEPAFHVALGPARTVMAAMQMMGHAIRMIEQSFQSSAIPDEIRRLVMNQLLSMMEDMPGGVLIELNTMPGEILDIESVKKIIYMETVPLLENGLLFGYLLAGKLDETALVLQEIGRDCGYAFQVMNDLEPFCDIDGNVQHKGGINLDILQSKKNLAGAYLYNMLSKKEKTALVNYMGAAKEDLVLQLCSKYNVRNAFADEINLLEQQVLEKIESLDQLGITSEWSNSFGFFIQNLFKKCRQRIQLK